MKHNKEVLFGIVAILTIAGVCILALQRSRQPQRCPTTLAIQGARCCGDGQRFDNGKCTGRPLRCAKSMKVTSAGCVPNTRRVHFDGGQLLIAPSDWEAQGRVEVRRVSVGAFSIDSHELTEGEYAQCVHEKACVAAPSRGESGLPQTNLSAAEAAQYCRWRGGRLPSSDEHAFAMMGKDARRYPWGQTGAVCRRASFGLETGPCARGGRGPDLAGARPDGASPEGVHDLAGNVAEWTVRSTQRHEARGGSWRTVAASELRAWNTRVVPEESRKDDVGARCAYAR